MGNQRHVKRRACGVLLPVFSLPSAYGIGAVSEAAYAFVDFLADAGQRYWQVLPLGQTGYGDSPYQCYSTFAGNPYFIDIDRLIADGLLTEKDVARFDFGGQDGKVDYSRLSENRKKLLRIAYRNSGFSLKNKKTPDPQTERAFSAFCKKHEAWLADYALFMVLRDVHKGKPWYTWEEGIRLRKPRALKRLAREYADEIRFYEYQQFLFSMHWSALKLYANLKGIELIGDIPIYVSFDSADTWSHPELFALDRNNRPIEVAGVPPDAFSATGQLWGNPVYRWDAHARDGYAWWIARLEHAFSQADVLRIDHFRGFEAYYAVPYGEKTAEKGEWRKGPGIALFKAMEQALGKQKVIAEDLGFLTPTVHRLLKQSGYPGMKVLQFAFDPREESDYLPHNYTENCVVYTGTHDNDTTAGWFRGLKRADRAFAKRYLHVKQAKDVTSAMIRAAYASVAHTAIIPLQDWLQLGSEARINTPSTIGDNWDWRLRPGRCTAALAAQMREMAKTYGRLPDEGEKKPAARGRRKRKTSG